MSEGRSANFRLGAAAASRARGGSAWRCGLPASRRMPCSGGSSSTACCSVSACCCWRQARSSSSLPTGTSSAAMPSSRWSRFPSSWRSLPAGDSASIRRSAKRRSSLPSLFTGALLALVGQTYQTGADTYELFALWAFAITAWVAVARLPALWLVVARASQRRDLSVPRHVRRSCAACFGPREMLWLAVRPRHAGADRLGSAGRVGHRVAARAMGGPGRRVGRRRRPSRRWPSGPGSIVHADASPIVAYFAYVAWLAAVYVGRIGGARWTCSCSRAPCSR